jgi:hypothetical protein
MSTIFPTPTTSASAGEPVWVDGDRIHVENAVFHDPVAAALIRRGAGRGTPALTVVERVIQTGARAIEQASGGIQIDHARAVFEHAASQVTAAFTDTTSTAAAQITAELGRLLDPTTGELARLLAGHTASLEKALTATFDASSSGAVQHQVTKRVADALGESHQALLSQLSIANTNSPLARLHDAITAVVAEQARRQDDATRQLTEGLGAVRAAIAEMRGAAEATAAASEVLAREKERSTHKGFEFEGHVGDILEDLAAGHGDTYEDVATTTGAGGRSKKGDAVIDIDGHSGPRTGRVVFEIKTQQLSLRRALDVLDGSLTAREADYAVLVVPDEATLPRGTRGLQEHGGNMLLVALTGDSLDREILQLAYRYVRVRVRLSRTARARMDAGAVQGAIDAATTSLRAASSILTTLAGAGRGIEQARLSLTQMTDEITDRLAEVERILGCRAPAAGPQNPS